MQGAACVGGALGGLGAARFLLGLGVLTEPINLVYLTLLGLLCGYLVSPPLVRAARALQTWVKRVPPGAVLAAGMGAAFALFVTVLLNSVLERVPGFSWPVSLLLTLLLVGASCWFSVANRTLLTPSVLRAAPPSPPTETKVLDTSALIDGRLAEVAEAGFLTGTLLLPRFVLLELQRVADAGDPERRKRGRRALAVLETLKALPGVTLEVTADDPEDALEVDTKLVGLCRARRAALLTTDYNLGRVALLEGVRVMNLHALASALRSSLVAGDRLTLRVVKTGREAGQGLGYLDDGTLIVVEGAAGQVGKTVQATVTSHLQTHVGRMVFAKLEPDPRGPRAP